MFSKQVLLGLGLVVGGGIVLAAVVTRPEPPPPPVKFDEIVIKEKVVQPEVQVLTADIETEKKIVAEKQKKREHDVAENEQRTKELLRLQEQAKQEANNRAEAEASAYVPQPLAVQIRPESQVLANKQADSVRKVRVAKEMAAEQGKVQANVPAVADESKAEKTNTNKTNEQKPQDTKAQNAKKDTKPKNGHVVQAGDNLVRLSRQYGVSVEAIAAANNMGRDDNLPRGKTLKIPSANEARQLEHNYKAKTKAEQKATHKTDQKMHTEDTKAQNTKDTKPKNGHVVQAGDNLVRLSRQYGVSVEAIAAANNMGRDDNLPRGKTLKIPSASEVRQLENVAARKAQEKAKKAEANQRLAMARQEAKKQGVNEKYAVQVLLAANQENADKVVKQLKAAGYKATTSQDKRGVRVVVGPERSREAAMALKDKIKHDTAIDARGAWVTQLK